MKPLRAFAIIATLLSSTQVQAVDFEVSAPSLADIELVAQNIAGLWSPDSIGPGGDIPAHINTGGADPNGWAWVPWGTWYVQSGTTVVNGVTVPNMVAKDSNYYGLLRWNGPLESIPLPPGILLVTGSQTVNGVTEPTYTITVPVPDGSVTLASPPDPTFPVQME